MKVNMSVDVHHLTRVEGHGNIHVRIEDGVLLDARWDVVETPRYFEVMLEGKSYQSAGLLTSRICGICSIGHCLASVRATENAFGIELPELAAKLRLLAKHGETLQSHALHLFFLVAPDFLQVPSVLPLLKSQPELVNIARNLKGLANRLCDLVAGRTTHPICIQVGGVTRRPDQAKLRAMRPEFVAALDDLVQTAEVFKTFSIPDFSRETEFVSLKAETNYPWIGGRLVSSDGVSRSERAYQAMTNEYVDKSNTSKWCKLSRDSFAVGALARFNNNHHWLHPEARQIARSLGLEPICHNPYMNNVAQLVECVHVVHEITSLIDEILEMPDDAPLRTEVTPRASEGVAAVEVPRGILYHHFRYDDEGRIVAANCVIPTTQNNANIHIDLEALVKQFMGVDDEKLELLCSMLVRAYDPCISCSVH